MAYSIRDRAPASESTLAACVEWSILQGIGSKMKTARKLPRQKFSDGVALQHSAPILHPIDNEIAFLEAALRYLLLEWRALPSRWPSTTFASLQRKLKHLCQELDHFVNPLIATKNAAPAAETGAYSNLRAVQDFLSNLSERGETAVINLVMAANAAIRPDNCALFLIPEDRARDILDAVDSCNTFLEDTLLGDMGDERPQPSASARTPAPSGSAFGRRANAVLQSLFNNFSRSCTSNHDVRLSLYDDFEATEADSCETVLQMLLSGCSCPEKWHEAECWPYG